jgi:hypothetical protein
MYDTLPPQIGLPLAGFLWFLVVLMLVVHARREKVARDKVRRAARRETFIRIHKSETKLYLEAQKMHLTLPRHTVRNEIDTRANR